jgi:hypothetical protein
MAEVVVVAEVAEAEVLKIEDDVLEVVESRTPDGLAVLLRARPSGRHYRVAPTRDPRQPRFWCLMVIRCSSAGVPHPSELPWAGGWGTRWEDLATDLALIRADVNAWLAQDQCAGLRSWLMTPDPEPPPTLTATGTPPVRGRSSSRAASVARVARAAEAEGEADTDAGAGTAG